MLSIPKKMIGPEPCTRADDELQTWPIEIRRMDRGVRVDKFI